MVTTEAMSQGLPVVTTESDGASEVIKSGENGLVIPARNAAALAEAISWCAENRGALHVMAVHARETAASWQWSDYRRAVSGAVARALGGGGNSSQSQENIV
jgi:glycosyltransferase involved in cell wall biosynthesis